MTAVRSPSGRVVEIGGIRLDDLGFTGAVDAIEAWALEGSGGYVCTPNVDFLVRARRDPAFLVALADARLRLPDGMGVVYGARLRGTPLSGTVTGRKLPEALAARLAGTPHSIGLLGGPPGAADAAARRLAMLGVDVSVAMAPSMTFEIGSTEDAACTAAIAGARPRILFVGLGAPKQELWMRRHQTDLPETVLVGVGQAIAVLAGDVATAPEWMTRVGLEWAFRLVQEPRRLARRYLRDDPRFFWWMLKDRFQR